MWCSLWEGLACSQAAQSFGILQTQRLKKSWIKIALQHCHLRLVKCLQGTIITLELQGKTIKNTRGGENTLSFLLWKLLILWSPLLPLASELFPVCLHWFWTDDKMWKEIILPNKIQGLYPGRSEFLKYLVEDKWAEPFPAKTQARAQAKHNTFLI